MIGERSKMQYRRLGNAGVQVSQICLGTMTFGREADEATSFKLMDRFIELGGNFIDTADMYSDGLSEEIIGRWFRQRGGKKDLLLATKVYATMGKGPNDGGLSRYHIFKGVEASLRRLQIETIDLYQIHRWDPNTPVEETLEALNDLVRQGKVRYIGCSNLAAWHLAKYLQAAKENHWTRFISLQPVYNALNRSIENELLPLCAADGLGVIAYNPLAGGMLTGKYERGKPIPEGVRLQVMPLYAHRYLYKDAFDVIEAFTRHAAERGVTPAQLALAWVIAEPRVTCPIIGARNLEQLEDTLGGLDLKLTPEERAAVPTVAPRRWVGVDPVYDREE